MTSMETWKVMSTENTPDLHWIELALDNPLFKVSYIKAAGTHLYSVDISQNSPTKKGLRNMNFEVVFPLYTALTDIIQAGKTAETTEVKIIASSREYWEIVHVVEFPVDQWSYTRMDILITGLAEQLTRKQNLNGGLLIKLTFTE